MSQPTASPVRTTIEYAGRIGHSSRVVHLITGFEKDGKLTSAAVQCGTRGGRYGLGVPRKTSEAVSCAKCLEKLADRRG